MHAVRRDTNSIRRVRYCTISVVWYVFETFCLSIICRIKYEIDWRSSKQLGHSIHSRKAQYSKSMECMCRNVPIDTNSLTVPLKSFSVVYFSNLKLFSFSVYHIQDQEFQVQMATEMFSNTDSLSF